MGISSYIRCHSHRLKGLLRSTSAVVSRVVVFHSFIFTLEFLGVANLQLVPIVINKRVALAAATYQICFWSTAMEVEMKLWLWSCTEPFCVT